MQYKQDLFAATRGAPSEQDLYDGDGDELVIPSFEDICGVIEAGAQSHNPDEIIPAVNSLKTLIMNGTPFNLDRFVSSLLPILRGLARVQPQPVMAAEVMQLFEVIQCCNIPISPLFLSKEFLEFCWETARYSQVEVAVHAFECICNIARTSPESRDLVMTRFPVGMLESEIIQKGDAHSDLRQCAMELVHVYAQFKIDPEIGRAIVTLCKNCLEAGCEKLHSVAVTTLLALLDTCPDVSDMVKMSPIPDLVDTIAHGVDKEQLIPAVQLMKFYFMSGMTLMDHSLINFISLLGHRDTEISALTYKSLKQLMKVKPELIESIRLDYLIDVLDQAIHRSASTVKARVGKFFCWAVSKRASLAEALVRSRQMDIFIELLQFEDLNALQLQVLNLLVQIIRRFDSPDYRICEQLHDCGIEEILDHDWDTEELARASSAFQEIYTEGLKLQLEQPQAADRAPDPPKRKRGIKRVVRQTPPTSEPEEDDVPPPPRPRLWVKHIPKLADA